MRKVLLSASAAAWVLAATVSMPAQAQVDPVTVGAYIETLGTAAEALGKVKALFGGDSDAAQMKKSLKAIQEQNRVTHKKLDEILTVLGKLDVIVQDSVRSELVVGKKTNLIGRIQSVEDRYEVSFGDERERAVAKEVFRSQRPEIEAIAGELMNTDTYGYGHYDAVGQAFVAEYVISQRLDEPLSTFRQRAARYRDFFTTVLDPARAGTITYAINQNAERRARLATRLAADEAALPGLVWDGKKVNKTGGRMCSWQVIDRVAIRRNQSGAFEVVKIGERETPRDCDVPSPRLTGPLSTTTDPDPADPGLANPASRVKYLNDTQALIGRIDARLKLLEQARLDAIGWRDIADGLAKAPS